MKFVDEATILVAAGKGGNGSCSFRREKFIPFGGPDGGDGGNGGSIYLQADSGLNTLIDFRYIREIKADSGMGGSGAQRSGRSGEDKVILVPVGTMVKDEDGNFIGDLTKPGERLLVARGGQRGVGNLHFKSSTNRAPRQFTPGKPGEVRHIKLELKLLADVGLLGFPNAGKSTLISAVSAARPKVADYPFTTLIPNLGVVRIDSARSFVMADIPGIIEGAAEGAGLGLKFLKHLSRTRVLLHLVDILGLDDRQPEDAVAAIEQELLKYDENLATKPRWLVFNKIDCIDKEEQDEIVERTVKALNWQGPVFKVSAATGEGTAHLCQELMKFLPTQKTEEELQLEQEAIDARKMDDAFDAQFEDASLDEDEAVA